MKSKKALLLVLSSTAACSVAATSFFLVNKIDLQKGGADAHVLTIDASHPLDGGNISTPGGTNIHFDEYGVNEAVSSGFLELGAYGCITLQSHISGIDYVEVWSETGEGKEFFLTAGATPNSAEYTVASEDGFCTMDFQSEFNTDLFYFAVHNKTDNPLILNQIKIHYSCVDDDAELKRLIDSHFPSSRIITFDYKEFDPYYGYDIDPSKIPSNRKLIKTMTEFPTAPGEYTYGYEVYDVDEDGNPRKLLYTKTYNLTITGYSIEPFPDEKKVLTFHIPNPDGTEKLVYKETFDGHFDITQIPDECLGYNWDSPYNSFTGIGDEHYYPVFNVTGISPNKEGDGCLPVNVHYSYFERGFEMPEPTMKKGYRFGGWFMDQECTIPFDENVMHPGNLVLYAKCVETNLEVRPVYYHNEDGTLMNHVDYLYSDDTEVTLPDPTDYTTLPREMNNLRWSSFVENNYLGIYKPSVTSSSTKGDKIKYSDFSTHHGDIRFYVTDIKEIPDVDYCYDLFSKDTEGNNVYQHTMMASTYQSETDFVIPATAIKAKDHTYHYDDDAFPIQRTGQFFCTDEKKAYLYDGGTLKNIASYAYANIEMAKPLEGILRHEGVRKVGRRAFFNRYGLKGTYFPKYAGEFDIEAYANVTFNDILTLPKGLTKIGARCFIEAKKIKFVCLPRSIKSIGQDAFALGDYNKSTRVFENIHPRNGTGTQPAYNPINFLYEGSETEFNALDEITRNAILDNANSITYNYSYGTYYGRG